VIRPPDFMTYVAIYGFIGWLGLAVGAWLVGAFVAARQGRWGWFALALCLPYAGSLLYSGLESVAPQTARGRAA
jgi:zinc transporter ZupT